jgi:hypothetical protein
MNRPTLLKTRGARGSFSKEVYSVIIRYRTARAKYYIHTQPERWFFTEGQPKQVA